MAIPSIEAQLDSKEFDKFLFAIKTRFENKGQAYKTLASIAYARVYKDVIDHFRAEEGPDGPWAAWSKAYAAHMERIGKGGNKILQNTGRLRQSFNVASKQSSEGVTFSNPARTSSGFPYGQAHDEGGKKLPQRKFMWISDDAMEDISQSFLSWALDGTE